MIHQFAYFSIAFNEGNFYLIPEPSQCPKIRNCSNEVYWGYANVNTLNGGQGVIFPSSTNYINPSMQDLQFEYQTGTYSKMDIIFYEVKEGSSKKHILNVLPEFVEPNKFNSPTDAINYLFPFLKDLVKCENLEDIKKVFGL